jgi:hypothetical protein
MFEIQRFTEALKNDGARPNLFQVVMQDYQIVWAQNYLFLQNQHNCLDQL